MRYLIIFISLIVSSCASVMQHNLIEADDNILSNRNCSFVGQVEGDAGEPYFGNHSRIAAAKNEAIESAINLKATHINWGQTAVQLTSVHVTGKAYKCTSK